MVIKVVIYGGFYGDFYGGFYGGFMVVFMVVFGGFMVVSWWFWPSKTEI